MNPKRLKEIEQLLEGCLKPLINKYYKLSNGNYLLIEPGKAGFKTVIELIYEGEENITGRVYETLEEINKEYPGVMDANNEINSLSNNVNDIFI